MHTLWQPVRGICRMIPASAPPLHLPSPLPSIHPHAPLADKVGIIVNYVCFACNSGGTTEVLCIIVLGLRVTGVSDVASKRRIDGFFTVILEVPLLCDEQQPGLRPQQE
jgi:hypothetical protein